MEFSTTMRSWTPRMLQLLIIWGFVGSRAAPLGSSVVSSCVDQLLCSTLPPEDACKEELIQKLCPVMCDTCPEGIIKESKPPLCEPECQNGGKCISENVCECLIGYTGSFCEEPMCSNMCRNGGSCIAPNTCDCSPGYTGDLCQNSLCSETCHNGGTCIGPDTCACSPGFTGALCQNVIVCEDHPLCSSMNEEDCKDVLVKAKCQKFCKLCDSSHTNGHQCNEHCSSVFDPVCGTNGVTYDNFCLLELVACWSPEVNLTKEHDGQCTKNCNANCDPTFNPVCGTDGKNYENFCQLTISACWSPEKKIQRAYMGECKSIQAKESRGGKRSSVPILSDPYLNHCHEGYERVGKQCILKSEKSLPWIAAKETCEKQNSLLVEVRDKEIDIYLDNQACKHPFVLVNDGCVWIPQDKKNWESAKTFCEDKGATLLVPKGNLDIEDLGTWIKERRNIYEIDNACEDTWPTNLCMDGVRKNPDGTMTIGSCSCSEIKSSGLCENPQYGHGSCRKTCGHCVLKPVNFNGTAHSTTMYAGSGGFPPEKAFDGNRKTYWVSDLDKTYPQSIWFEFTNPIVVNKFAFRSTDLDRETVDYGPTEYEFFFSDGPDCSQSSTWVTIYTDNSGVPFTKENERKEANIPNNKDAHKCYGFKVNKIHLVHDNGIVVTMSDIQFWEIMPALASPATIMQDDQSFWIGGETRSNTWLTGDTISSVWKEGEPDKGQCVHIELDVNDAPHVIGYMDCSHSHLFVCRRNPTNYWVGATDTWAKDACPDGSPKIGGQCLFISESRLVWSEAKETCENMNGRLFQPRNDKSILEYHRKNYGGGCIGGISIGHQCLTFSDEALTWDEAASACALSGGRLSSLAEPADVLAYIIKHYRGVQFWAGGSDTAKEGNWVWLSGEPFNDFPWGVNQPVNGGDVQDCLVVGWNNTYDDQQCSYKKRYICEADNTFWLGASDCNVENLRWSKPINACIQGNNDKIVTISTMEICKEMCIEETDFICRSIEFSSGNKTCRMSSKSSISPNIEWKKPCKVAGFVFSERLEGTWTWNSCATVKDPYLSAVTKIDGLDDCMAIGPYGFTSMRCLTHNLFICDLSHYVNEWRWVSGVKVPDEFSWSQQSDGTLDEQCMNYPNLETYAAQSCSSQKPYLCEDKCPLINTKVADQCLYISTDRVPWQAAKQHCEEMSGELIQPRDQKLILEYHQNNWSPLNSYYGPQAKIWSDADCTPIGLHSGKSAAECKDLCDSTVGCSAINYKENFCDLRDCGSLVPKPIRDLSPWVGYSKVTTHFAKIIDSTGHQDNKPAVNIIDDDIETYWNPVGDRYNNKWEIVFELDDRYLVYGINLVNYGDVTHDITKFTLEASDDRNIWRMRGSVSNVETGTRESQRIEFEGPQATGKYLRFTITETLSGYQPLPREISFVGKPVKDFVCEKENIIGSQCLIFSQDQKTWNDARDACSEIKGAHLLTLSQPDLVKKIVVEKLGADTFWTGGNDLALEGNWEWVTGEPFMNFPWPVQAPENEENLDCLLIGQNGYFDKVECFKTHRYICEIDMTFWMGASYTDGNWLWNTGTPLEAQYQTDVGTTKSQNCLALGHKGMNGIDCHTHNFYMCDVSKAYTRAIQEIDFESIGGEAKATSVWSQHWNPINAFIGNKNGWHNNRESTLPQVLWYEFKVAESIRRFSFRSRTDNTKPELYGPSKYIFWGSNGVDCSVEATWKILFEDFSGTPFDAENTPKEEDINNINFYRCYGFKVLESKAGSDTAISNVRMYLTPLELNITTRATILLPLIIKDLVMLNNTNQPCPTPMCICPLGEILVDAINPSTGCTICDCRDECKSLTPTGYWIDVRFQSSGCPPDSRPINNLRKPGHLCCQTNDVIIDLCSTPNDAICPTVIVCASDGQKYSGCKFNEAKCRNPHLMQVPCTEGCIQICQKDYNPICASNRVEYSNRCFFNNAKCKNPLLIEVDCLKSGCQDASACENLRIVADSACREPIIQQTCPAMCDMCIGGLDECTSLKPSGFWISMHYNSPGCPTGTLAVDRVFKAGGICCQPISITEELDDCQSLKPAGFWIGVYINSPGCPSGSLPVENASRSGGLCCQPITNTPGLNDCTSLQPAGFFVGVHRKPPVCPPGSLPVESTSRVGGLCCQPITNTPGTCSNGCHNGGTCIGHNECVCSFGWTGITCEMTTTVIDFNHTLFIDNLIGDIGSLTEITWRDDLRCGLEFPSKNGQPATCNANSDYPCCSPCGWCGNTRLHCLCRECLDYSQRAHDHSIAIAIKGLQSICHAGDSCESTYATLLNLVEQQRQNIRSLELQNSRKNMTLKLLEFDYQQLTVKLERLMGLKFKCHPPFSHIAASDECVYFSMEHKKWTDADIYCKSQNSQLYIPDSFTEAGSYMLMNSLGLTNEPFIGASNSGPNRPFTWVDDKDLSNSDFFLPPDISQRHCAVFRPIVNKLKAVDCELPRPFICKKNKS